MTARIIVGDARERLADLPAGAVRCCVTSPPYFGLRDYGVAGQIGAEQTPDEYLAALVEVFRAVRRVLADDGTLWLNLGDSYCSTDKWGGGGNIGKNTVAADGSVPSWAVRRKRDKMPGFKPKDLLMIPARVGLALQADGWYLRSHIIWHKPNPMPESVRDRPTGAHESVFLLAKQPKYFYDADAVREPLTEQRNYRNWEDRKALGAAVRRGDPGLSGDVNRSCGVGANPAGRNLRNVWTITPKPFKGAHFATFPPDLAERCIKAGSAAGDTVLDPFAGAGTTLLAAKRLGRNGVGIELNADYADMARARLRAEFPLLDYAEAAE